jgi:hypothetical protein
MATRSPRKLRIIRRVEAGLGNLWRLELSCGHFTSEVSRKKPSIWYVEALGRRRQKRCRECEREESTQ